MTETAASVNSLYGFATYEANDRGQIPSLFAWRSGAREEFEVKDKSVAKDPGYFCAVCLGRL